MEKKTMTTTTTAGLLKCGHCGLRFLDPVEIPIGQGDLTTGVCPACMSESFSYEGRAE